MRILDPEISSVGTTEVTLAFATGDDDGNAAHADAEIVLRPAEGGPKRIIAARGDDAEPDTATRLVRVGELEPGVLYDVDLRCNGELAPPDALFFPGEFRTLAPPPGERIGAIATVSDLHFGEKVCGLGPNADIRPVFRASDEDPPYWQYMNELVVDDVNAAGVDAVVVKGDITGEGHATEFGIARMAFDRFTVPWHAVLGNHDQMQEGVAGLDILGQPSDPAWAVDAGGARLVLIDTVDPGKDGGVFPTGRLDALADVLSSGGVAPTLVFGHHYTSDPNKRRKRSFGVRRDHTEAMLEVFARHRNVRGYFAGHTHRNRLRRFPETGQMPHVEVCCTKDYPGGWGLYTIYEGGYTQEVRRSSGAAALRWAAKTKSMYFGLYRHYALGPLDERCFTYRW